MPSYSWARIEFCPVRGPAEENPEDRRCGRNGLGDFITRTRGDQTRHDTIDMSLLQAHLCCFVLSGYRPQISHGIAVTIPIT